MLRRIHISHLTLRLICASAFFLMASACAAHAAIPHITSRNEVLVGQEAVLSVDGSSLPGDSSIEWAVSGEVNPILLRDGGRECAFTPVNTSPITVVTVVRDRNGEVLGSTDLTVVPREFTVEISVADEGSIMVWDPVQKEENPMQGLVSGRPIRLRAELKPPFRGKASFVWVGDAATAVLSHDNAPEILIRRGQVGASEISVKAFNASGVLMGRGETAVNISLPLSLAEGSARDKDAWETWLKSRALWDQKKYAEAMELAKQALARSPRDPDISSGVRAMTANYSRLLRALDFQKKGADQRKKGQIEDALKTYRFAQVVWPMSDTETAIQELEKDVDALRIKRQQAEWLRDTASAYDQEGFYQDAMEYYGKSVAIISSDAVQSRMERISQRLSLMAEADRYAGEGSALERDGNISEAINRYGASVASNPDENLRQHIIELESVITKRRRQAGVLYREAADLQKRGNNAEALHRYMESRLMWETPEAQRRIAELGNTAKPKDAPLRTPEDFGIGTKADSLRLMRSANILYLQRKYQEALNLYRKSYALSASDDVKSAIDELEALLRDRNAVQAANNRIREGNALYRQGKIQEALGKYGESLELHPNAEVEAFIRDARGGVAGEARQDGAKTAGAKK